jgi:arylsulfatase A-like enzyme
VSQTTPARWTTSRPRSVLEKATINLGSSLDVLLLSGWCGLTAGLLEAGMRVLCRTIDTTDRLYWMSRHFVWVTPLANMLVFLGFGLCLAAMTWLWPRRGAWLSARIFCALAILPMLMVAVPQIFPEAWFILALGIASQLVPWLGRQSTNVRAWLLRTFPFLLGVVLILAGSVFGGDWLKERREASRALPPADSPNVLLIVLDTVRSDHLSLYGYHRATTPTLERLAKRGARFDAARAPAPWTLTSHASFFTGRWPHELEVDWSAPLRTNFPTLAEYLGPHGYATAGIVANSTYCSYDTGLARGFTHYEDYVLAKLMFLRTAVLVEEFVRTLYIWELRYDVSLLHSLRSFADEWINADARRDARSINRAFLDWLERRHQVARPFFMFLNYKDAHAPYKLPEGATHRFGRKPQTRDEIRIIYDAWTEIDKLELPREYLTMARDCYDDCIAYLDEQLGSLFDDLERRGILDKTLVVITSDHGEGLGEHDLFDHGESLYKTEIGVPLLILPPSGHRSEAVVRETVSLRDLPATVVDLAHMGAGSPFPGRSLATLWRGSSSVAVPATDEAVVSELRTPNPGNPNRGRSPAHRGSMISLADGDFVYIRNEGNGTEQLFNERDDPRELTNRAGVDAYKPVLERFRESLARIKPGALGIAR